MFKDDIMGFSEEFCIHPKVCPLYASALFSVLFMHMLNW